MVPFYYYFNLCIWSNSLKEVFFSLFLSWLDDKNNEENLIFIFSVYDRRKKDTFGADGGKDIRVISSI